MWYLLTRGLVGPQSRYGSFGEDKKSCPSRDCESYIPYTSHCTDWTIAAQQSFRTNSISGTAVRERRGHFCIYSKHACNAISLTLFLLQFLNHRMLVISSKSPQNVSLHKCLTQIASIYWDVTVVSCLQCGFDCTDTGCPVRTKPALSERRLVWWSPENRRDNSKFKTA